MKKDVVPDPGKTAVLEAELECYRSQFTSSAELYACREISLLSEDHRG